MRPDSREGTLGTQKRSGRSTAPLILSAFPWQQRNTTPCAVHWVLGGAPSAQVLSWDLLSLQSPWLRWEGVGFKRLLLGDFFPQGKEKRDFEAGWGHRCPQAGEVRFVICANHLELESLLALLRGSRDGGTAGSWQLGVRSLPRGSLSQRRPCQSLWCRAR